MMLYNAVLLGYMARYWRHCNQFVEGIVQAIAAPRIPFRPQHKRKTDPLLSSPRAKLKSTNVALNKSNFSELVDRF